MMTNDYYVEASSIAKSLEEAGFHEDALGILSAMEEGATGTEIFMILKFRLASIMKSRALPPQLEVRAKELHDRLGQALS